MFFEYLSSPYPSRNGASFRTLSTYHPKLAKTNHDIVVSVCIRNTGARKAKVLRMAIALWTCFLETKNEWRSLCGAFGKDG